MTEANKLREALVKAREAMYWIRGNAPTYAMSNGEEPRLDYCTNAKWKSDAAIGIINAALAAQPQPEQPAAPGAGEASEFERGRTIGFRQVGEIIEKFKSMGGFDSAIDAARAEGVAEGRREGLGEALGDLAEYRRMIPDLHSLTVCTHNPVHQVYFRAGLLACREVMARFVEQGGDKQTAQSIRANWWPSLGDDPGIPRQLTYDEVAVEKPDGGIDHANTPPSVEALPYAYAFINGGYIAALRDKPGEK